MPCNGMRARKHGRRPRGSGHELLCFGIPLFIWKNSGTPRQIWQIGRIIPMVCRKTATKEIRASGYPPFTLKTSAYAPPASRRMRPVATPCSRIFPSRGISARIALPPDLMPDLPNAAERRSDYGIHPCGSGLRSPEYLSNQALPYLKIGCYVWKIEKIRPVVIVTFDVLNATGRTAVVVPLSSPPAPPPSIVITIPPAGKHSVAVYNQAPAVNKTRFINRFGGVSTGDMRMLLGQSAMWMPG